MLSQAFDHQPLGVAEVVPLKQGLKLIEFLLDMLKSIIVAEVVPLKQGLKHQF